mmetsp:Transcript_105459/g.227292  ORF Transcript_105459/g.227292 Transcript_105459/m.227292 type:complete len:123 (+) Transcript_105459:1071-1439(+)
MTLDLSTVEPCLSGPKRPHDRVLLKDMKTDFNACLPNKNGFKGFEVPQQDLKKTIKFQKNGQDLELKHGSVVIAAITSCTNTSNPDVMVQAGLVCRNANRLGLQVKPFVKTSLSPGSGVVQK